MTSSRPLVALAVPETPPDRSVVSVNSSVCPGSHGVFERDAIEQVQDLRARVVAQDLVRQILNRDGGHTMYSFGGSAQHLSYEGPATLQAMQALSKEEEGVKSSLLR